jgi:hypothetical protein
MVAIAALKPLPDGASALTLYVGMPSAVGVPVASVAKRLLSYAILMRESQPTVGVIEAPLFW